MPKPLQNRFAQRALLNIAAIVAVSTIFGAKAVELERRAALAAPATTVASASMTAP